jgi:hypothetical protein
MSTSIRRQISKADNESGEAGHSITHHVTDSIEMLGYRDGARNMQIRRAFNDTFGLEDDLETERKRFVDRVNQIIFYEIDTAHFYRFNYEEVFEPLCFECGVNPRDLPKRRIGDTHGPAEIRALTRDDFAETLLVLCVLYSHIKYHSESESGKQWLSKQIQKVLSQCTRDIEIRWEAGFFYPAWAGQSHEAK